VVSGQRIVVLGLAITSSWGNGHATGYRGLVRALEGRGHDVLFLERDVPWYAEHRDLPEPPHGRTELYGSTEELVDRFGRDVADADLVVVGSYVPDGVAVGRWVLDRARGVRAFYDIDTPVTLAALARGECEYLVPELVPRYDVYLSFTGGPTLREIERRWGSPSARAFPCFVDPDAYRPVDAPLRWALGHLGTASTDRRPPFVRLLLEVARRLPDERFAVAGPGYPDVASWPANLEHFDHLAPPAHPRFYCEQRCTLNITRADMVRAGWSPSVRLFEAAACGVPIVSDVWPGIDEMFRPDAEILLATTTDDVIGHLGRSDDDLAAIGRASRAVVLARHTADVRAEELERHVAEARALRRAS
jgi:spore maturation protein CgeB